MFSIYPEKLIKSNALLFCYPFIIFLMRMPYTSAHLSHTYPKDLTSA